MENEFARTGVADSCSTGELPDPKIRRLEDTSVLSRNKLNEMNYWNRFYHRFRPGNPSQFALFCADKFLSRNDHLIDCGCGNGRDSKYFMSLGMKVFPIDSCYPMFNPAIQTDCLNYEYRENVYSRWFIHSIPPETRESWIQKLEREMQPGKLLMIEARSSLEPLENRPPEDHPRYYLDSGEIIERLQRNFRLIHFQESRGMSVHAKDNPMLFRIISIKE